MRHLSEVLVLKNEEILRDISLLALRLERYLILNLCFKNGKLIRNGVKVKWKWNGSKMLIEWKWIFFENALIIYSCALLPLRFRSGRNRHLYPNEVRAVVVKIGPFWALSPF